MNTHYCSLVLLGILSNSHLEKNQYFEYYKYYFLLLFLIRDSLSDLIFKPDVLFFFQDITVNDNPYRNNGQQNGESHDDAPFAQ